MESIMGPHRNREDLGNGEIRFNMAQRRHQHNMDSKPWLKMYEQDFQNELSLVMVWIWKVSYMCKWFKHLIPVSDNIWAVVETNMWDLSIRSRPLVTGLKVIAPPASHLRLVFLILCDTISCFQETIASFHLFSTMKLNNNIMSSLFPVMFLLRLMIKKQKQKAWWLSLLGQLAFSIASNATSFLCPCPQCSNLLKLWVTSVQKTASV